MREGSKSFQTICRDKNTLHPPLHKGNNEKETRERKMQRRSEANIEHIFGRNIVAKEVRQGYRVIKRSTTKRHVCSAPSKTRE